jgi:dUTP pyrophosphatase
MKKRRYATDLSVKTFDANNAQPPEKMTDGAAGFDFYAEEIIKETPRLIWYRTGYGVRIPRGHFGDLRARSSVSKTGLILANGAGVVDPDYQGEIQFRFYKNERDELPAHETEFPDYVLDGQPYIRKTDVYEPGDRIGQLILVPFRNDYTGVTVVEDFKESTERGEGGFGSTGD